MIRAVVNDIEGTTSSISFVHEVLFPYARRELPRFLRNRAEEPAVAAELAAVRSEMGEPRAELPQLIAQLQAWIDADRKVGPLKRLQGMIWELGYRNGDFRGHVYPDAERALRAWHRAGIALYVYSSGSVAAQQLLFEHSEWGDLRPLFSGYFDTGIGLKREADSYRRLAAALETLPADLLFLSDVAAELDAAAAAGLLGCEVRRDGAPGCGRYPVAKDFAQLSQLFGLPAAVE